MDLTSSNSLNYKDYKPILLGLIAVLSSLLTVVLFFQSLFLGSLCVVIFLTALIFLWEQKNISYDIRTALESRTLNELMGLFPQEKLQRIFLEMIANQQWDAIRKILIHTLPEWQLSTFLYLALQDLQICTEKISLAKEASLHEHFLKHIVILYDYNCKEYVSIILRIYDSLQKNIPLENEIHYGNILDLLLNIRDELHQIPNAIATKLVENVK